MLACVSPSDINAHETLSTLQYASRARAVQNQAVANVKSAPVLTADTGKMNQEGDNQGNAKGPARGQSGDMVAIQEEVESSLVNALRVQTGEVYIRALLSMLKPQDVFMNPTHILASVWLEDAINQQSESASERPDDIDAKDDQDGEEGDFDEDEDKSKTYRMPLGGGGAGKGGINRTVVCVESHLSNLEITPKLRQLLQLQRLHLGKLL